MPENLLDRVDAVLGQALSLDRYLRRVHTDDHTEPHSDRQSTGHMKRLSMDKTVRIVYGKVVDAIAYCHWYKVQPEGAKTTIPCCMLSGTALTPFGVREHNQLQPNAGVYILLHPGSPYGVIMGVEPKHQFDGTKGLSDYISCCSAHSIQTEQVHSFPFTLPMNGSIVDWSAGRPVDGTCAGEWGMFAESGVGEFVDSAMAFLKSDENTGFWAFYRDQLARVSGHNIQIRSAGWEVEALDDQGEFNHIEGFTPYPWEQLGAFEFGTDTHKENSVSAQQISEPYYSKWEPLENDQQPFHRTRHYHGYAGQGGKRVVVAPPVGASGVNTYSKRDRHIGLFDESVAQTGLWTVRTAKGVRIIKKSLIPVAKAIARPESKTGDDHTDYMAASKQGSGDPHRVTGDIETSGEDPGMQRAAGALDGDAYATNWEAYVGFHYHKNDYYLPEEAEMLNDVGSNQARIDFSSLSSRNSLNPPQPSQVKIDHRYNQVKIYPTYSYFEMLDDGGVILGDGYGSEIRMVGGNIYITCPGDLFLQPGRRLVGMSGTDTMFRARKNFEASTTEKDVRIHSGRNMELGAEGGVLVESKSVETGWSGWQDKVGEDVMQNGIHLKAANSSVCAWSDLLYLRTGVEGPGVGMYFDAGQGQGAVAVNCDSLQTWARTAIADYLGSGSEVTAAYIWSASGAVIGGNLCQDGSLISTGSILADQWIESASAHFASALSDQFNGLVGLLKDRPLEEAKTAVAECKSSHGTAKTQGGDNYIQTWDEGYYASEMCGDPATIDAISASFRDSSQYRSDDFRLFESRWQQLARLWGTSVSNWSEIPITKAGQETYPFPGKEKLVDDEAFRTQDLTMYDLEQGVAQGRDGGGYEQPRYGEPTPAVLNESYTVID
jgi:hypothetical protein